MKKTLIVNRFDKQLLYQYMYRIDLLFFLSYKQYIFMDLFIHWYLSIIYLFIYSYNFSLLFFISGNLEWLNTKFAWHTLMYIELNIHHYYIFLRWFCTVCRTFRQKLCVWPFGFRLYCGRYQRQ